MARETESRRGGFGVLDALLLVVGGVVAVVVAFAVLHFVAGLVWDLVKLAIVAAVVLGLLWLIVGRRR